MPKKKTWRFGAMAEFLPENQRNGETYIPNRASKFIRSIDIDLWKWVVDSAYYERIPVGQWLEEVLWSEHDKRKKEFEEATKKK